MDDTLTALVEDILNEDISTGAPTSLPTVVDTDAPSGVPTPASSVLPTRGDGTNAPTPQTLPTVITNKPTTAVPTPTPKTPLPIANPDSCDVGPWSDWSQCSITCGNKDSGLSFRWRIVKDNRSTTNTPLLEPCPSFVETNPCTPIQTDCSK